jgi:hypothetical integral membrane protein (TIGR02206 family)
VTGAGSPSLYWSAVAVCAVALCVLCLFARRYPIAGRRWPLWIMTGLLIGEQVSWQLGFVVHHNWTVRQSLPFDVCDITAWIAAAACLTAAPFLIELTYFWALAGTLQAIATPDVGATFPHLEFENYLVEHVVIVMTAVYFVVGLRCRPRPGAVPRIFGITVAYTAFVGVIDYVTNGNYMFLRRPPPYVSLLSELGPWPWYILAATGIGLALFVVLDIPFMTGRADRD